MVFGIVVPFASLFQSMSDKKKLNNFVTKTSNTFTHFIYLIVGEKCQYLRCTRAYKIINGNSVVKFGTFTHIGRESQCHRTILNKLLSHYLFLAIKNPIETLLPVATLKHNLIHTNSDDRTVDVLRKYSSKNMLYNEVSYFVYK